MNVTAPDTVATGILPILVTLVRARKQARWQWKHSAGEHQHKWVMVLDRLDTRIAQYEEQLAEHLDMLTFRMKREIVE